MPRVGGEVQGRRGGRDEVEQTARAALGLGLAVVAAAPAVAGASAQSRRMGRGRGQAAASPGADISRRATAPSRWTRAALRAGLAVGAEGGARRAGDELDGALAARAGRRLRALRGLRGSDHGGQARRQAPGHQDLGRARHRRSAPRRPRRRHQLGFHASVRSPEGAWYIDPYYKHDDSVYVSYFTRDLTDDERFVEQRGRGARLGRWRLGRGRRRARGPAAHLPARARHRSRPTPPTSAARPTSPRPRSR